MEILQSRATPKKCNNACICDRLTCHHLRRQPTSGPRHERNATHWPLQQRSGSKSIISSASAVSTIPQATVWGLDLTSTNSQGNTWETFLLNKRFRWSEGCSVLSWISKFRALFVRGTVCDATHVIEAAGSCIITMTACGTVGRRANLAAQ